jgi:hypothetical protein
VVSLLLDAFEEGGVERVRQLFNTLVEAHPGLAALAAGEAARQKTGWSADELMATQFPEMVWLIPGILPEGLTFLGGKRKLGKSWLGLQVALAVGTGEAS